MSMHNLILLRGYDELGKEPHIKASMEYSWNDGNVKLECLVKIPPKCHFFPPQILHGIPWD
jgi:hypothetical protein